MVKSGWVLAVPHFLFYLFSIDVRSSGRSKDIFFPLAVSNCWYLIIHAIMGKLLLSGDLFLPCIHRWTYKKHSFSHLDLDVLSAAPIVNSWNYRCDYPNFCLNVLFGYWNNQCNLEHFWQVNDRFSSELSSTWILLPHFALSADWKLGLAFVIWSCTIGRYSGYNKYMCAINYAFLLISYVRNALYSYSTEYTLLKKY